MNRRGAIVALLAAAGVAALVARDEENPWPLPVEHIAERVERIRGHRFERVPSVEVLSRREFDRELARGLGPDSRRRRAALLALSLAGIGDARELEKGPPLRGSTVSARRVLISRELLERDPVEAEAVLAHELTHALELEQFGLENLPWDWLIDLHLARGALLEGTAMLVESQYRIRHQGVRARPRAYARRLAKSAGGDVSRTAALAAYWNLPYSAGTRYVTALHRDGGWKAVDRALRSRPTSTAEILHPGAPPPREAYPPLPPRDALSRSRVKHLGELDIGEMDTRIVLRVGVAAGRARRAAAGILAGSADVWVSRTDCEPPCRRHAAVLFAWRARDRRAARRLAQTLRYGLVNAYRARRGGGALRLKEGAAAVAAHGTGVRYAFAPSPRAARSLVD